MEQDPYRFFRIEAAELSERLARGVLMLSQGASGVRIDELLRAAHTLKGAARVVKHRALAESAHAIEELLSPLRDGSAASATGVVDALLSASGGIAKLVREMSPAPAGLASSRPPAHVPVEPHEEEVRPVATDAEELGRFVDGVSEVSVQVRAVRTTAGELNRMRHLAALLVSQIDSVAPQEGQRTQVLSKARSIAAELEHLAEDVERSVASGLEQTERELSEVQASAERLRLVPCRLVEEALARTAHDVARELGKRVTFSMHGADVRLDAQALTRVRGALVQAVRNVVAHGIELPDERARLRKGVEGSRSRSRGRSERVHREGGFRTADAARHHTGARLRMTIRVLVGDDSITVRKRLIEILRSDPQIEVVGEAEDGKRAIELCRLLRPDVVTLDMMMPVMSGLAATEYIMAYFPTPILIVSASTNRGELFRTYEALAAGAVDVLDKAMDEIENWEQTFISTVKVVARVRVITHPRARLAAGGIGRSLSPAPSVLESGKYRALALGASTGGPGALLSVLRHFTKPPPLPILVVLHLNERFGTAFPDWLGGQVSLEVTYARHDEPLSGARGRVLIAPPGRHMVVSAGRVAVVSGPERHSCRPSVDVLFESIATEYGDTALACLLTGMGRDGASGLLAIRGAGGRTIAQDEATSVVYGMPREAAMLGAAERILPVEGIGPALLSFMERRGLS